MRIYTLGWSKVFLGLRISTLGWFKLFVGFRICCRCLCSLQVNWTRWPCKVPSDSNDSMTLRHPVLGGAETSSVPLGIPLGTLSFEAVSECPLKCSWSDLGRYKTGLSVGNVRAFPCLSQRRRGGSTERHVIHSGLGSACWKRQHTILQADTPSTHSLVPPANTNSAKKAKCASDYLDLSWVCGYLCPVPLPVPRGDLFRSLVCPIWRKRFLNRKDLI